MAGDDHTNERVAVLEEKARSGAVALGEVVLKIDQLSDIRADGKLILSKLEDIKIAQATITERFDAQDEEIAALTRRADRMDGALAIIVAIAGSVGGAIGYGLHWLTDFVFPHPK